MFGILTLALNASILIYRATRFLLGNYLLALLRERKYLKYGVPAMLLAIPYLWFAFWLNDRIQAGAPLWLYIFVIGCGFSGARFIVFGPWSLLLLAKARTAEAWAARRDRISGQRPEPESTLTV